MERVKAIGGVFFKSENPKALYQWYETHLGIKAQEGCGATFQWRDFEDSSKEGCTAWSLFPKDTKYFNPSQASFMVNYIVDDLHALLAALRAEGVTVDDRVEEHEYGKFGWIADPEGNRIELWEPPKP